MSCCGNSRSENAIRPMGTLQPYPITTQQPSPHPLITPFQDKQQAFQPPSIVSPPPVHAVPRFNGGAQSPPPPSTTTHSSLPPSSPPPALSQMGAFNLVDPTGSLNPLRRPSPAYPAAGNPNILSTYQSPALPMTASVPPTDDGKMSVSIDFGESLASPDEPVPRSLTLVQGLLSLAW